MAAGRVTGFSLADYYTGERNAGVALTLLGIVSAASAARIVLTRGLLTRIAWPLALGALLELSVGGRMAVNAQRTLARQLSANAQMFVALATTVAAQARAYLIATRVELVLVVVSATSFRTVPLWPQLREILGAYLVQRPPARLLFPSYQTGEEAMVTDWRKLLDRVAQMAGWEPGDIRSKMFRHTFTAARLQTLDQGAPVSVYTVVRELGHGGESMVRRVYGHLGSIRRRSKVVEYRVRHNRRAIGEPA